MGVQMTDRRLFLWRVLKARTDFRHLIHDGHIISMCFISRYVSSPKEVGGMAEIEAEHPDSKTLQFIFISQN